MTELFSESAVKIAPNSLVVRWNLYRIYLEDGEYQKANDEYNEMVRINMSVTKNMQALPLRRKRREILRALKKYGIKLNTAPREIQNCLNMCEH